MAEAHLLGQCRSQVVHIDSAIWLCEEPMHMLESEDHRGLSNTNDWVHGLLCACARYQQSRDETGVSCAGHDRDVSATVAGVVQYVGRTGGQSSRMRLQMTSPPT